MDFDTYKSIYDRVGSKSNVVAVHKSNPKIPLETIQSIYFRRRHSEARKSMWNLGTLNLSADSLWKEFKSECAKPTEPVDALMALITRYFNLSPCLFSRVLLKSYYSTMPHSKDDAKLSVSFFTQLLKDPSLIQEESLRIAILHAIQVDDVYSPQMDSYRHNIGIEYEKKLTDILIELKVPFCSEDKMRQLGFPKTPDACLLEPIAVKLPNNQTAIIKWIESKAWFGDPASHQSYLRDQYRPYYNRFGPGLVIYWFGFVRESSKEQIQGIYICDHFPLTKITRLTSPYLEPNHPTAINKDPS